MKDEALEALGPQVWRLDTPYWRDKEVEEKIKRKKKVNQKLLQHGDEQTKQQYKNLNKEVKQEVVKKNNSPWEQKYQYNQTTI
ncbi:unnamed protein product [Diabrotica balteata]|uniref:Uncharacterized protein n=1 Tax=Diabrotica balteata TaxID=107213 RepID=A0A9N9SN58_DIABA|nr:unnamed protein product [Diabrotica balteata]